MADLKAFLRRLAREPFSYGELDCASVLGRWWEINHGVNPGAHLLGTYHNADGCADLLMSQRGLLRLVFNICRSIGAQRTTEPQPGDFGVVRMGRLHFGAIRTPSGKWAIKGCDGLIVTSQCKPVMIWSI